MGFVASIIQWIIYAIIFCMLVFNTYVSYMTLQFVTISKLMDKAKSFTKK